MKMFTGLLSLLAISIMGMWGLGALLGGSSDASAWLIQSVADWTGIRLGSLNEALVVPLWLGVLGAAAMLFAFCSLMQRVMGGFWDASAIRPR